MSNTAHFKVGFDGAALREHEMNVALFAPSLMALAQLLEDAAKLTSAGTGKAQVNVKGNIKAGSIEIDLTVATGLLNSLRDMLAGDSTTAVLNGYQILQLLGFVGGSTFSLFKLIKWLRGKRPDKTVDNHNGTSTIHFENHATIVDNRVIYLFQNINIRNDIYNILKPLDEEGIDVFLAGENGTSEPLVTKDERAYFVPPIIEDVQILENESKKAFSIVALSFKEDNKWRLSDGAMTFSVEIKDDEFLKLVGLNDISFSKGDVLVCTLLTRQWQNLEGVKTEYVVTKVLEHLPSYKQMPLV